MDELRRRPAYDNGSLLLVFTPVQFIDVFLSPDIGVFSVGLCPDLIKVPKFSTVTVVTDPFSFRIDFWT